MALTPATFTPADADGSDATIQVIAKPPSVVPIAKDDTYSIAPNNGGFPTSVTVPGSNGVLANDTDANGPMNAVLVHSYSATLTGAGESPPNASTATGSAQIDINTVANILHVHLTFSGLTGGAATAVHIHSATAAPGTGLAGIALPFDTFPAAASGTYDKTFDLTLLATYDPAFVTANGGTAGER